MKESRVEEIHHQLEEREQEKRKTKTVSKTPRKTKWWIGIGVAVLLFYFYQRGGIERDQIIFLGLVGVVVWWLLSQDKEVVQMPITEREAKAALFSNLKWKQVNAYDDDYEIPPEAKIKIIGPCVLRNLEGKPWKWEIGYQVRHPGGLVKTFSGDVHPYRTHIIGIRERATGFTGNESPDIRYIKSPKLSQEKRYQDVVGKVKS